LEIIMKTDKDTIKYFYMLFLNPCRVMGRMYHLKCQEISQRLLQDCSVLTLKPMEKQK